MAGKGETESTLGIMRVAWADCGGDVLDICGLLANRAGSGPDRIAIEAPGRLPLSYMNLERNVRQVMGGLRAAGVRRGNRVAVALPDGPEMAIAILAVSSASVCAPLNPLCGRLDGERHLSAVGARWLLALEGRGSPLRDAAVGGGVCVLGIRTGNQAADGIYRLLAEDVTADIQTPPADAIPPSGVSGPGDVAVVLPTSGTTGSPKVVPLTRKNLAVAVRSVCQSLALGPADTCLCMMPQFHIGGVVDLLLAPLVSGGRIVCTPGFDAGQFLNWLELYRPTWFQAVPATLSALLAQMQRAGHRDLRSSLRFIRSVASPLSPRMAAELEDVFQVPVIQTYGMTEAAPLITTIPLPPGHRKPGSVGRSVGPEIVIVDGAGNRLPPEAVGEIVIRGENVTDGYENAPDAKAQTFRKGWFHTGDLGWFDRDGDLFLSGRLNELVNRGGEKVAPAEIDQVLAEHPAVAEAVAYPLPHPVLGEELAVAVVPKPGTVPTPEELRRFVAARLAPFKVPRAIVVTGAIPKGPTGKAQRSLLHRQLEALPDNAVRSGYPPMTAANNECIAPRTVTEERLQSIWRTVLGADHFGIRDSYFELGGDSLSVIRMLVEVERAFGKALQPDLFFQRPYIEDLASALETEGPPTDWSTVLTFSASGDRPPLFCMEMHNAGTFVHLARLLGHDQPCYGIQPLSLGGLADRFTIESVAAHLIQQIRTVRPQGPYALCGLCAGGNVAYEMAQQLKAQGEEVVLLALMDSFLGRPPVVPYAVFRVLQKLNHRQIKPFLKQVKSLSGYAPGMWWSQWRRAQTEARQRSEERAVRQKEKLERRQNPYAREIENRLHQLRKATRRACALYVPKHYDGRLLLFLAKETDPEWVYGSRTAWRTLALKGSEEHTVPGRHSAMLLEPGVSQMARKIRESMDHGCWGA